jgi:hypothetical protein
MKVAATAMEVITLEVAQEMARAVRQPLGPTSLAEAMEVLDRWFEAERRGALHFEPGVREVLMALRPPRRH